MSAPAFHMLVIDDDAVIRELLEGYFSSEGYAVTSLATAEGALELVQSGDFDICLIDIRLPGKDGLTLTREIRASSSVGIILVTSKDDLVDRIVGLESGADDYVIKPFDARELLSRVKNVLRRISSGGTEIQSRTWSFDNWSLDQAKRVLLAPNGERVTLSEGEFLLLVALAESPGVIMTRDELTNKIRNREWHPDDRYVDVLVVKLRQKFKKYVPDSSYITTVHGKGYLFEPETSHG